jgi:hypothetical protein
MTISHKHLDRTLLRSLVAVAAISALIASSAVAAVTQTTRTQPSARTTTVRTYTAPRFPVPASARVQPSTGGTAGVPTGTGTVTTPTGTTGTGGVLPTSTTTVPQTTTTTPTFTAATPPPTATNAPVGGVRGSTAKAAAGSNRGSSRISTPALLLAALAALLALGCAIWSVARLQAFEPRWTLSLRHTLAEAGFRASATWAEFSDWARLGR